ncbi:hypothetical protein [Rhizobium sp. K102]|uniref:hypothetical protein n=1 Tax=Rhizobium sp. K102 TaxID=2918527 RepID=UPI001EFB0447|nr:hypothetical protein [Rhizobium sp. K102]ULR45471.1 hypothetical protein MHI61_09810 [Rhizobium sp. K102]
MTRSGKSGTVELPKHVHRVTKRRKNGAETVYTFYTKFRNTAAAWPSLALPEPVERDFQSRVAICEALERDDKGFLLDGKRLPDHAEKDFWPASRKSL